MYNTAEVHIFAEKQKQMESNNNPQIETLI